MTRLRREAWRALAAGRFYRHTLIARAPADLRLRLGERWPGDGKRGAAILAGEIEFAGELVRNPSPVWFPSGAGPGWLAEWHGFGWLADLIGACRLCGEVVGLGVLCWNIYQPSGVHVIVVGSEGELQHRKTSSSIRKKIAVNDV